MNHGLSDATVAKICGVLARFPAVEKAVLYGSRARGDAEPDSDVDVAIVVRDATADTRDRIYREVADVELETLVPLSTVVFSADDFHRLLEGERRIALDIEHEGIAL